MMIVGLQDFIGLTKLENLPHRRDAFHDDWPRFGLKAPPDSKRRANTEMGSCLPGRPPLYCWSGRQFVGRSPISPAANQRPNALVREEIQQKRMLYPTVDDACGAHARLNRLHGTMDLRQHAALDDSLPYQAVDALHIQLADELSRGIE